MILRHQLLFWIGALLLLTVLLVVLRSILLPFLLGMILAYMLDPLADRLERWGLGRMSAALVILVLALMVLALAVIGIVPPLGRQIENFIERLPQLTAGLQDLASNLYEDTLGRLAGVEQSGPLKLDELFGQSATWLGTLLTSIWNRGQAVVNVISLLVVAPVVAFYMLVDWDRMVSKVDTYLPRAHRLTIRGLFKEIDRAVAGFVRGQGTVCVILGTFYAVGLSLVGLNFGLLIGIVAGLISFIPYVGSIVGFILSIGVALVQFWPDWTMVLVVAAIFGAGQFFEGNILQPRLVGSSVGVHPVWLMFALFAFGAMFGFVGLLLAVPAASAVTILMRFALRRYMASPLYRGASRSA